MSVLRQAYRKRWHQATLFPFGICGSRGRYFFKGSWGRDHQTRGIEQYAVRARTLEVRARFGHGTSPASYRAAYSAARAWFSARSRSSLKTGMRTSTVLFGMKVL